MRSVKRIHSTITLALQLRGEGRKMQAKAYVPSLLFVLVVVGGGLCKCLFCVVFHLQHSVNVC